MGEMSRAFVKETDETVDELPDRPLSPHPNLVTPRGLAAIEDTLARLRKQQAAAQASGDRAALATLSRDLRYWAARRASAQVVPTSPDAGEVRFGCALTIRRDDGRNQTYRIVGEDEADPAHGTISYVSPVARAPMGKGVGDVVRAGSSDVEIVAIA
jgi:transcription elongation GreA/GreB family factor